MSGGANLSDRVCWIVAWLSRRTVAVLLIMFCLAAAFMFWQASLSYTRLVESAALNEATHYSDLLSEFRTLYTSEVVNRANAHGMEVSHDYTTKEGAIPLPATLSVLLGRRMSEAGKSDQVRLYSDHPFPWNIDGGPRDAFETEAIFQLRRNPARAFYRFEETDGRQVFRYATADVMRQACVSCHNSHPQSPKTDWKVGDVRGVLEVTLPMDAPIAQAEGESWGAFMLIGSAGLFGLLGIAVVTRKLHCTTAELEERVKRRTVELEDSRLALSERVQLLALGSDIAVAVARSDGAPQMLQQCAETIVRHLDASFARIWTLSECGQFLELRASAGLYTHLDGPHSVIPVGQLKIGWIAQERKPHITNQVIGDPRVSDQAWARREGMVAFAGHPLVVNGRLVGVVALFARHNLSQTTCAALAPVADTIAVGIDRKRQEGFREQADRRMRLAVEAAPNGMVMINNQGVITLVNTKLEEMFGYQREALLGQPVEMLMPGRFRPQHPAHRRRFLKALQARSMGEGRDLFGVHKDGTEFPVELGLNPIETDDGFMVLAAVVDITQRKQAEQTISDALGELARMAHHDSLTGLLNRHSLNEQLASEWNRSSRSGAPLTCVILDADYFKRINDTYGHATGDDVLRKLAELLQDCCRDSDRVARYGGEEFCVLLADMDEQCAVHWAEGVRKRIAEEVVLAGEHEIRITASFGVSQRLPDTMGPDDLLGHADEALRVAKQLGRDQVVGFGQLNGVSEATPNGTADVLAEISARDVMTPLVVPLRRSYRVHEAVELLLQTRLDMLPVVDDAGKLMSVIAEDDLAAHLLAGDSWQCSVEEKANRRTICFNADASASEIFEFLRRASVRRVVVVNERQQPIGVISHGTIMRWLRNAAHFKEASSQSAGSNGLPLSRERLVKVIDQLNVQVNTLREQIETESENTSVLLIGAVTRIQEVLDEALAHSRSNRESPQCNTNVATASELLA